jgi:hypothetical protein
MPGGVTWRFEQSNAFGDLLIAGDGLKGWRIDFSR